MRKSEEEKNMAIVLNYVKKEIKPALNQNEFLDLFFDKNKREATYKQFEKKSEELEEDDFVGLMKKRIQIEE